MNLVTENTIEAKANRIEKQLLTLGNFLSPASFLKPAALVKSAWTAHAPFAFWLIEALRPGVLVELGTHKGFSYLAFCQAIRHLRLSTKAFAIDTWTGDEHAGFYGDEIFFRLKAYHDPRFAGFSQFLRMSFDSALTHFAATPSISFISVGVISMMT